MFLLHPRVADRLNTHSLYSAFATEGLAGPLGRTLHAQQANRLVAFGHHCLASSGGAASLCGGAAGPGGGLAGASGAPFSGAATVAAGGSNGAAGGVPMGGQDLGRFYNYASVFSPYLVDDVAEVEPLDATGAPSLLARGFGAATDSKGLASGPPSGDGLSNNNMYHLSTYYGTKHPDRKGGKTCPQPPTQSKNQNGI